MHKIAEYGMASHWAYTDGKKRAIQPNSHEKLSDLYNTPWLSSIKEWQDEVLCSRDFVDCVRRELLGKRVFVFLRNGKILNLAKGSTVIDAAFQIHTEVGLTMHGVEINGKPVCFIHLFYFIFLRFYFFGLTSNMIFWCYTVRFLFLMN